MLDWKYCLEGESLESLVWTKLSVQVTSLNRVGWEFAILLHNLWKYMKLILTHSKDGLWGHPVHNKTLFSRWAGKKPVNILFAIKKWNNVSNLLLFNSHRNCFKEANYFNYFVSYLCKIILQEYVKMSALYQWEPALKFPLQKLVSNKMAEVSWGSTI